ncbi:MAG: DUF4340 domain-containing protein [Candidatus Limivicinus sp.]
MKRFKRLGLLLAALVIACVGTLWLTHYEEKKEQIKNMDEIILEIPTEDVQSLSWEYEEEALAFHYNGTWLYDGDEAFPVDEEKVHDLLRQFEALGAAFIIEEPEDLSQYGLEEPTCTIHIATEDESYDIKLGAFSKMDQQRYVDIGDGNVYLVKEDPFEDYEIVLSDMIDHDDMPDFDSVTLLTFQGAENYSILYEEESTKSYSADDTYFTQDGKALDPKLVKSYLNNITGLNPKDYVTYNATAEELTEFGMDAPELTVTVNYTYEVESEDKDAEPEQVKETFVLHVSRNPEEVAAAAESEEETEISSYVRAGESQIVYQISEDEYELLMEASYNDLRHQEVFWADWDDVTQIDITLEDADHTIVRETDEDGNTLWRFPQPEEDPAETTEATESTDSTEATEAEEDDTLDLSSLKNALKALTADSFTDESPTQKEEIRLTLYLDNENHPKTELIFYRYDGTHCLAMIDGKSVSLVKRSAVMTLVEAVQAMVL